MSQNAPHLWMPIVKAESQGDGRLKVTGLATDCSQDEQDEIVKASSNPSCIRFINQGRAIFDYNHNSDRGGPMVGRPESARFLSQAEARSKYPDYQIEGPAIEVTGYINPLGSKPDLAPNDLKTLHHYADVGERLGFSIRAPQVGGGFEMRNGKKVPVAIPGQIYKIAIAEQPVNGNSPCFIAKSLHALDHINEAEVAGIEVEAVQWNERVPQLLVMGGDAAIIKALTSEGGIATPGSSSGEALKIQDLMGVSNGTSEGDSDKKPARRCLKCGGTVSARRKYCGDCGELCKSLGELTRDVFAAVLTPSI